MTTPYRGAAVVRFQAEQLHAVTGHLMMAGKPAGPGDLSVETGPPLISPISREGAFYFDKLPPGSYQVRAAFDDSGCRLTLTVPASDEAIVDLGELECRAEAP